MVLRILGVLLIAGGLYLAGYFFLSFKTTVTSEPREIMGRMIGGGETHNIGLLSDRENGVAIGIGLANLGGLFVIAGTLETAFRVRQMPA
jgi:hypothetical protein